jgi:hypothetical protein
MDPSSQTAIDIDQRTDLISRQTFWTLLRAVTVQDDDELTANESSSTLFRFGRSKHVVDLKLIFLLALFVLAVHVIVACFLLDYKGGKIDTYLGPAVPIYGAIVAWAYLSAAKRLGVVDLFACEIRTLCRVGTAFDVGRLYVKKYQDLIEKSKGDGAETQAMNKPVVPKPPADSNAFSSNEEYFPVFTNNSGDLEALEALVVAHITEFYTYMKAARDLLRALAAVDSVPETKKIFENLIYVLFLGYESGRNAVKDLVEFEPTRAENIMIILLTELVCYSFLCTHFKDSKEPGDELRFARLELRESGYKSDIPELYRQVTSPHGENEEDWKSAKGTAPELAKRYLEAFGEEISAPLA